MFAELAPLLKERTLMLTVARIDEVRIQVNVIPKSHKEHDQTEAALATPLSLTGTAEELDRDLAAQLKSFVATVVRTGSNLKEIEEAHNTAIKEIEAKNKEALDKKRKASGGAKAAADEKAKLPGPVVKDGKPVFGTKNGPSETGSLFDAPTGNAGTTAPTETPVSESKEIAGAEIEEGANRNTSKSEPLNYPD
jgi:PRTRC genetic system protein E